MPNPYLAKLHGLVGAQKSPNPEMCHQAEPSKPSKLGFEDFEGGPRKHFFEFECSSGLTQLCMIDSTKNSENAPRADPQNLQSVFAALRERCPDHVEDRRWLGSVQDGQRFLVEWGEQAEALVLTARDLFGLHEVPANPHPRYQRLSRYDEIGLVWSLQGCPVVALTEATAAIKMPTGSIVAYRRHNKPAYGPAIPRTISRPDYA